MNLDRILGQGHIKERIYDSIQKKNFPQSKILVDKDGYGGLNFAIEIARELLNQKNSYSGDVLDHPDLHFSFPTFASVKDTENLYAEWISFVKQFPFSDFQKWSTFIGNTTSQGSIKVPEIDKIQKKAVLKSFLGGNKVFILWGSETMMPQTSNKLLKILEEPPKKVLILLITHQPLRLMPTIRSRCRSLTCKSLSSEDLTKALEQLEIGDVYNNEQINILANGSVGSSVELTSNDGIEIYNSFIQLAGQIPQLNRQLVQSIADACTGKNASKKYELTLQLFILFTSRLAKFGASNRQVNNGILPSEAKAFYNLAPDIQSARKWANFTQIISERTNHARSVNLDPSMVILDMLLKFEETSKKH